MKHQIFNLVVRGISFILSTAVFLLIPAGTMLWWNGLVFLAYIGGLGVLTGSIMTSSPGPAQERSADRPGSKFIPMMVALLPLAVVVVAGFDKRLGWTTPLPVYISLLSLGVMVIGTTLTTWAMKINPFFSRNLRIQGDRDHAVVTGGPYRKIRHPGYAGAIIYNLGIPILLGSMVAFWVSLAFL
jgi:protein-S-isoprenylcysteine O-methyltransferase Ste14